MIFTEAQLSAWLAAFMWPMMRISAMIAAAPVFSSRQTPTRLRIGISLLLSFMLMPLIPPPPVVEVFSPAALLIALQQVLIGLVMGLVGRFMFAAIEFAGTVVGFQMGLSMANMFDPMSEQQISMLARFETAIAMLVFLMMDLHLIIVQAMVRSYSLLPPGGANMNNDLAREILNLSAGVFSIGFQIGAPLIIALFLSNMIIGLLARSVPQIQIFVVGFPLTLLLGFVFLMFGIPFLVKAFRRMFGMLDNQILDILRLMGLS
mgnify:CR=1 FL=1